MTAASALTPVPERRRERRVPVNLPHSGSWYRSYAGEWFEERTSSVNLCRGGVAFATRYALDLGCRLEISIPAAQPSVESDAEFATQGRIVHVAPGRNDRELLIGVEFTGPRFHRMFISESTS